MYLENGMSQNSMTFDVGIIVLLQERIRIKSR